MNMLAAFDATIELAEKRGMSPAGNEEDDGLGLDHLRDMRTRIHSSFSQAKLGRWLGWAQCAVVASGVATLDEMKALNTSFSERRKA